MLWIWRPDLDPFNLNMIPFNNLTHFNHLKTGLVSWQPCLKVSTANFYNSSLCLRLSEDVKYFSYFTKSLFSRILQIWQLLFFLDTLSPFWSRHLPILTNDLFFFKSHICLCKVATRLLLKKCYDIKMVLLLRRLTIKFPMVSSW